MEYAQDIIIQNEGKVMEKEVMIVRQQPVAFPMEDAFQGVAFHKRLNMSDPGWNLSGSWMMDKDKSAIFSNKAGDELSLNFEGTGVSIEGWWIKEGGKADVYIDGVLKGTIDCFFYYANQEHRGINFEFAARQAFCKISRKGRKKGRISRLCDRSDWSRYF